MKDINYSGYFPMLEYYDKIVAPISKKYQIKSNRMRVCPLHDDHDPSLGIIKDEKRGEIYHCFGCNRYGNIVKLHQGVSQRLFNKHLTYTESIKELCNIFSVNYSSLPKEDEVEEPNIDLEFKEALNRFDISDFKERIIYGKVNNKPIGYFNTLLAVMINED